MVSALTATCDGSWDEGVPASGLASLWGRARFVFNAGAHAASDLAARLQHVRLLSQAVWVCVDTRARGGGTFFWGGAGGVAGARGRPQARSTADDGFGVPNARVATSSDLPLPTHTRANHDASDDIEGDNEGDYTFDR